MKRSFPLHTTFLLLGFALLNNAGLAIALSQSPKSTRRTTAERHHQQQFDYLRDDNYNEDSCLDPSKRLLFSSLLIGSVLTITTIMPTDAVANSKDLGNSPSQLTEAPSTSTASVDYKYILTKASKKALGGGKAGASAAVVQVCSLMWLRTAMNYQYVYGGTLITSLQTLWGQGKLPRLYQGLPFALIQGPLTRFGDTAANVGIFALLETQDWMPLPLKTACGSAVAGLWRIFLMPVDTSKTAMQVQGKEGFDRLIQKVKEEGPSPLYQGALASATATAAGHFPWFLTYNFLNEQLPIVSATDDLILSLLRSALLGFTSSCVSDCCSNSLRVIKTTKQTAGLSSGDADGPTKTTLTYPQIVKMIIETDGLAGLFGRGLQTRLLTNAIQGAAFSVLWKYFQQTGGSA